MNLDGIEVFVKVIQAGSFSRAAQQLGMPVTTVSGKVASLERRLGVTLIQRTTRKLNITQAGEAFFRRCVTALEEVSAGERELATSKKEPEGTLRITAPVDVGHVILPHLVRTYLKRHPKVKVELVVTNRVVDLVAEGVDLALRIGSLKDSTLIAKKFINTHGSLWASASYLKKRGTPAQPKDLQSHELISFTLEEDEIRLHRGDHSIEVPFRGRLRVDEFETLKAFVTHGDGIGLIPDFLCEEEEKTGKLIRLLPQWRSNSILISFVYPAQRFVPPRVQAFIALASELRCP